MVAFLLTICSVCIVLVIYPYVLYPIILRRLPSRQLQANPTHRTSVTLVFCAYNEAASMPEKLQNLSKLKLRHPNLQILAYDDNSSDDTLEQMLAHPGLLRVIQGPGRAGKAHGMKLLAKEATGEIIVFTDANVLLREDAIDNLMAYYADETVGGVCGTLHYLGHEASTTAAVGSAYWKLEERLKAEESRTGSVMGADGSIFSLRRSLYPEFPDSVLDDLTVSMAAVFAGKRLLKVNDVIAYERLVTSRSDEVSRKVRIATRAFHTHLFLNPQLYQMGALDRFKYVSRKIVRWFGGGFFTLGSLCFVVAMALISPALGAGSLILGGVIVLWGMQSRSGPVASVIEILIALIATQWGVLRAMGGKTQTIWTPAASR